MNVSKPKAVVKGTARRLTKPTPEPDSVAYSVEEAARALSLSERTVRSLVAGGDLGSLKVGRRRLISRSALYEFVEEPLD